MLNIAGIVQDSVVDGPGLRTAIFSQGCPHHCPGCHNQETWAFDTGTEMDIQQLYQIIRQNPLCRAVTFSGGEPFAQAEGFAELAKMLKTDGYEVASYSGYTFEELLNGTKEQQRLLRCIDVLIDGAFIMAERSLSLNFRGSRNQRILNVAESLRQGKAVPERSDRWQGEYADYIGEDL